MTRTAKPFQILKKLWLVGDSLLLTVAQGSAYSFGFDPVSANAQSFWFWLFLCAPRAKNKDIIALIFLGRL